MMKKLVLWILIIACMGTIFYFSSQEADDSGRASEGFTYTVIKFFDFNDTISDEKAMEIAIAVNGIVRKVAHFGIYAFLGFLIALLLNEYRLSYRYAVFYSTVIAFLYALTDELHQKFVPGRSAEIRDVAIDTTGALCGALFALAVVVIIKKYREKHTG